MTEQTTTPTKRPGTKLMYVGGTLMIFAVAIFILAAIVAATGGHLASPAGPLLLLLAGGVLVIIGFARRVLAALENKGSSNG